MNAYRKRSGDLETDGEEEDLSLNILFRGCKAKNFLPKGRKGKSEQRSRNQKRLVPKLSSSKPIAPLTDVEDEVDQSSNESTKARGRGPKEPGETREVDQSSELEEPRARGEKQTLEDIASNAPPPTPQAPAATDPLAVISSTAPSPKATPQALTSSQQFEELYPPGQRRISSPSSPSSLRHSKSKTIQRIGSPQQKRGRNSEGHRVCLSVIGIALIFYSVLDHNEGTKKKAKVSKFAQS